MQAKLAHFIWYKGMEGIFFSVQQPKCRRQLYEFICRLFIAAGSFRVHITMMNNLIPSYQYILNIKRKIAI